MKKSTRHFRVELGVSISSKIVMAHEGSLQFSRGTEKGTTATVMLPVVKEEV